jgi:hypothetical protein
MKSYLKDGIFVGEEDTKDSGSTQQKFDFEGIDGWIVSCPELVLDQIDNKQ